MTSSSTPAASAPPSSSTTATTESSPHTPTTTNGITNGSSPIIIPSMGPLVHAAFKSSMSVAKELKLLKAQVQDIAQVCNPVARGDLSQKITVPVQGVVMVQLKDVRVPLQHDQFKDGSDRLVPISS